MLLDILKSSIIKRQLLTKSEEGVLFNEYKGIIIPYLLGCDTCCSTSHKGKIIIIWNKLFLEELSVDERKFIILHELGHFKNTHLDDGTGERVFAAEVAADSYAIKNMGYEKAINAMKSIKNKLNVECEINEFAQRISIQESMEMARKYVKDATL